MKRSTQAAFRFLGDAGSSFRAVFSSEITTRTRGKPYWLESAAQRRKCFESAVKSKPVGNSAANSLLIDVVEKSAAKSFSLIATLRRSKDHALGKSVPREACHAVKLVNLPTAK
ncbi:hypothetical protein N9D23_04840 [Rubripirellula sp.]|nr:hypothetical protein [Rubripirellula sp.]MDF1844203.1 hypothetical protein [Rubripirellula sp.]